MKIASFIIAIIAIMATSVVAYDFHVGRQSGLGGTVLLSSPSASEALTCPTGLLNRDEIIFETGYQRKYELSDLNKVFVAAGYRYRNFSAVAGFSQFGKSDYYTEQLIKSAVTYDYSRFNFSLLVSEKLLKITGAETKWSLNAAALGLAGGVNCDKYHLGLVIDNLNQPKLDKNGVADDIIYNIYAEIEGSPQFSMTGRAAFEKNEKPNLSLGQYVRLYQHNALFWGVSNNPLAYGGGFEVKYSHWGLTYAVEYHPVLGFSHNVSLTFVSGELLR